MKGFLCQLYRTSSNQIFTSIFIMKLRELGVRGLKECATFSENREALKGIANMDDF